MKKHDESIKYCCILLDAEQGFPRAYFNDKRSAHAWARNHERTSLRTMATLSIVGENGIIEQWIPR